MIPLRRCSAAGSFLLYNLSIHGIARDADAPPAVKPVIQNQPHRKFHQRRNRRGIALRRFALDGENSIILVTLAQVARTEDGIVQATGFHHICRLAVRYLCRLVVKVIITVNFVGDLILCVADKQG